MYIQKFMVNKKIKGQFLLISSFVALILIGLLAILIGTVNVPLIQGIKSIFNSADEGTIYNSVIFYVRLPRVIVALLVGMNLSAAGVSAQSIFRNPMASPGIIGVSSGASFGALICIALGFSLKSIYYIPIFASVFSLISVIIVYNVSTKRMGNTTIKLILVGIAISMIVRALNNIIISVIENEQIAEYVFWSMGSLADRRWEHVFIIIVPSIICLCLFIFYARDLNILLLGDEEANVSGCNVKRTKRIFIILISISTAISVSVSGMITFVGLIVPHITRLIVGLDNKKLMKFSILFGSSFLILCDLLSRTVLSPREISVGILTSVVGAPLLLYLIEKKMEV